MARYPAPALNLPLTTEERFVFGAEPGKSSINIEEPELFSEPGVLLVRPDGTLYYGAVQTMPVTPGWPLLLRVSSRAVRGHAEP